MSETFEPVDFTDVREGDTGNPVRRPYDAEHVQIVDQGSTVTALYIPDPEQAGDPAHVLGSITDARYMSVEVVATAGRFYRKDGAAFSGWVVRTGADHGEPHPNKREALAQLRREITDYFTR